MLIDFFKIAGETNPVAFYNDDCTAPALNLIMEPVEPGITLLLFKGLKNTTHTLVNVCLKLLTCNEYTLLVWPCSVWRQVSVSGSHTLTMKS